MRWFTLGAALSLAGCASTGAGELEGTNPTLVIANVSVVDVRKERIIADQDVVLAGDSITYIADANRLRVPAHVPRIDGTGKFLAPGFADMHVHVSSEGDLLTFLANGVTTVRNMAGDAKTLELRRRVSAGQLIGPRILTAGPVLESGNRSSNADVVLADAEAARAEIRRQRDQGYDFVKVYNNMSRPVYEAVVTTARRMRLPVTGHVPFDVGLEGALAARQDSIEHFRGYVQELVPASSPVNPTGSFRDRSLAWNYISPALIPSLAKRTARAGVWNTPTLVFTVHELSPQAEHAQLMARPELRYLSRRGLPDRKTTPYLQGFSDEDYRAAQRGLDGQFQLLRALNEAGAGLLVGTDSWLGGFAYGEELRLLTRAGLSPARVMRMATLDAARFVREEHRRGTVEVGRVADLVLLDANPLIDIAATGRVSGVVTRGRFLSRTQLQSDLEKVASSLESSRQAVTSGTGS